MIKINAIGDVCPIPVIKVKDAIKELNGKGIIEITVDIALAISIFLVYNMKCTSHEVNFILWWWK